MQPPAPRAEPPPPLPAERSQPRLERPAAPPPAPEEKRSLFRRVVGSPRNEPRSDYANLPLRPSTAADLPKTAEAGPLVRPPAGRWDRAEEPPRAGELPSRFAPPRAAAQMRPEPAPEPPVDQVEPEDDYPEPPPLADEDGPFEDEFTLDDLDAAAFGPDDELPPFPEDELASLKRRRSGRALAVIGGMLAIVVIGGAAVFMFRSDTAVSSPPPIITADAGPTKVAPDEPVADAADSQGKLIYDRVDDNAGGDETTLVTTGEDPVADIPPDEADSADNPISRVIIPGGPGIDRPIAEAETADGEVVITDAGDAAATEAEPPSIGPRKVRTVVVRPDGTIVSSEATAVDESGEAIAAEGAAEVPMPPAEDEVAVADTARTEMDAVLEGADVAVNTDPLGEATLPADEAPATAVIGTAPAEEAIPDPPAEEAATLPDLPTSTPPAAERVQPVQPVQPRAAAPAPARQGTIVATPGSPDGPIDLTPGTRPAAGAAPASGGGGIQVQVSAQRSEAAALSAYRGLQQRYPGILGSYQARIVRADLGEKGVYYRVRIGPFAGGDAERLCEDLKAAGGECILAR
jgi:hypothetical protein